MTDKWIDYDELTESEEDLLKQLADRLENPPDNLSDYSQYWEIGDNNEHHSNATERTTETTRNRWSTSDNGQRSRSQGAEGEPRDRTR